MNFGKPQPAFLNAINFGEPKPAFLNAINQYKIQNNITKGILYMALGDKFNFSTEDMEKLMEYENYYQTSINNNEITYSDIIEVCEEYNINIKE